MSPVPNWNETPGTGRLRVFRVEIDRPAMGETVARFHLERVFEDAAGVVLASALAGSWVLPLAQALADAELAPIVGPVALGLEALTVKLYERSKAGQ